MILLAVLAFLPLPTAAESFRDHLSENLQLKCACLPYRSTFVDNRCYIAVQREVEYKNASAECSSIFSGAKVSTAAPASVFDAMLVEKSKFHTGSASSESKQIMCSYDNDYKCDAAQTMSNGRCVVRVPKKMNFVDAKNYCEKLGMELPAPANDVDNRIVREVLVKDPAWVDKSLTRDNGFNWKQGKTYSRWTTCDRPTGDNPRLHAGHEYRLRTCTKDTATVIDRNGYWSTGGVEFLMDVVCVKNAEKVFTNGASPCNYHEARVEEYPPVTGDACLMSTKLKFNQFLTPHTKTCYTSTQTTIRYEILGKATVETQRACEVLCDSESQCTAFSFKDQGLSSSCVMLSSASNEKCSVPTTIFMKKTTGCVARTNLAAEFGVDPCIDELVPSAFRGFGVWRICNPDKNKLYIIRAIDACGRRITLDNEKWNYLEKSGNMWEYKFKCGKVHAEVPIIAAYCVQAGAKKCPCGPIERVTESTITRATYNATPDKVNACNSGSSYLWANSAKAPTAAAGPMSTYDTARSFVTCKAGAWIVWCDSSYNNWAVTKLACEG